MRSLGKKWEEVVRREGWAAAAKYMRAKAFDIFPDGSETQSRNFSWDVMQSEAFSLYSDEHIDKLVDYLVEFFSARASDHQP